MTGLIGRPDLLKRVNERRILKALGVLGTATRGELARHAQLSQPTVNAIVRALLERGVVLEAGFAASGAGRRAQTYRLNVEHFCTAVVCAYRDHLDYSLAAADGSVLDRGVYQLNKGKTVLENLYGVLDSQTARTNSICAISVGVPGAVSLHGEVFAIPTLSEWENVPLASLLHGRYALPVYVENDINAMALGYYRTHCMENQQDIVYMHIDMGIGAGVVVNGGILRGWSSFAGEISYMCIGDGCQKGDAAPVEGLLQGAESHQARTLLVARMAVNVICTVNPSEIVLGGAFVDERLLAGVRRACEELLPVSAVPGFRLSGDEKSYYTKGLIHLVSLCADSSVYLRPSEGNG